MSEGKRRVVVDVSDAAPLSFEATSFGQVDGHLIVHDGDTTVAIFAPGGWLNVYDEAAQSASAA
jgi:hypothetical protein